MGRRNRKNKNKTKQLKAFKVLEDSAYEYHEAPSLTFIGSKWFIDELNKLFSDKATNYQPNKDNASEGL
jgi:hypothetical protein